RRPPGAAGQQRPRRPGAPPSRPPPEGRSPFYRPYGGDRFTASVSAGQRAGGGGSSACPGALASAATVAAAARLGGAARGGARQRQQPSGPWAARQGSGSDGRLLAVACEPQAIAP